jgi:hypothetical protein
MRTNRMLVPLLQIVLHLSAASLALADSRLNWVCAKPDRPDGRRVELVYAGPDRVPCRAYDHRSVSQTQLIADYQHSAGQCERQVDELLATLRADGYTCLDPQQPLAAPTGQKPGFNAIHDAPRALSDQTAYFAIVSTHPSAAAAQAAAAQFKASTPSLNAAVFPPPGGSADWLVVLAAYTNPEEAAKAVQLARASGLAPGAYFWSWPRPYPTGRPGWEAVSAQ